MDEKTQKLIKKRFDALPESVQEVILSSDYENTLIKIGQQYNLNVEQMGTLEIETTMTMMAITPLNSFEAELTLELGVDKEKGSQIVKDINEKIFLHIRDLLKLMNTPAGQEPSLDESAEEEKRIKTERINSIMPEKSELYSTPPIDSRADVQTLSKAGIEIIPEKLELNQNTPDLAEIKHNYDLQKSSVLAQKLSGTVTIPPKKTEHSLPNITNPSAQNKSAADPYREIPE